MAAVVAELRQAAPRRELPRAAKRPVRRTAPAALSHVRPGRSPGVFGEPRLRGDPPADKVLCATVPGVSSSIGPGSGAGSPQVIYQQIVRPASNGLSVAALVLGIVAIVLGVWMVIPFLGLFFAFVSLVPAVLATVFGVVALRRSHEIGLGRGSALTGLVLGGLTLAIGVLTTLVWIFAFVASAASRAAS